MLSRIAYRLLQNMPYARSMGAHLGPSGGKLRKLEKDLPSYQVPAEDKAFGLQSQ